MVCYAIPKRKRVCVCVCVCVCERERERERDQDPIFWKNELSAKNSINFYYQFIRCQPFF